MLVGRRSTDPVSKKGFRCSNRSLAVDDGLDFINVRLDWEAVVGRVKDRTVEVGLDNQPLPDCTVMRSGSGFTGPTRHFLCEDSSAALPRAAQRHIVLPLQAHTNTTPRLFRYFCEFLLSKSVVTVIII